MEPLNGYQRWWLGGETSDLKVFLTEEFSEVERTWRLVMWIAAGLFFLRGALDLFGPNPIDWRSEGLFRAVGTAEMSALAFWYGKKSAIGYRTGIVLAFIMSYGTAIGWGAYHHHVDMGFLAVPFVLSLVFGVLMWPRIGGLYWPVLGIVLPTFATLYALESPARHWVFYSFYFLVGLAFAVVFRRTRLRKSFALFIFRERLRDENTRDVLTGLLNRSGWRTYAETLYEEQTALGEPLNVAFLDIDHFKRVNDQHGHAIGDRVLMDTARILARHLPKRGILARLGGEEFVAALPDMTREQAESVLQRMRKAVSEHEGMARVTISIGLSQTSPSKDLVQAMHDADMLLLQAKEQGRNQVVCASAATLEVAPSEATVY